MPAEAPKAGASLAYAYRLSALKNSERRPPTSWVAQSRRGRGFQALPDDVVKFHIDFEGPALAQLPPGAEIDADLALTNGVRQFLVVHPNEVRGGWRLVVQAKRTDKEKPMELRAHLRRGGQALSETWSYRRPRPVNDPLKPPAAAPLAPPTCRTPMAATPWRGLSLLSWLFRREPGPADVDGPARGAGRRRRLVLLVLSLAPAVYATYLMSGLLPDEASSIAEKALLGVFAILSCWLAAGFWTAMMGFVVLLRGGDRHLVSRSAAGAGRLPDDARTAVVMPICNEDVERVFAGLRAMRESLAETGAEETFDLFILSDSVEPGDQPAIIRLTWAEWRRDASPRRAGLLPTAGGSARSARAATSPTSVDAGARIPLHGRVRRRQRDERRTLVSWST